MHLVSRRTALVGVGAAAFAAPRGFAQTSNVEVRRNLEYGKHDGVLLTGDLYSPSTPGKFPLVIGVHGGGWQAGARTTYQYWGPWLAQRGYGFFAISYRLIKDGKKMFPESVHDVRAAIQFMRSRGEALKTDPDRLALMGDSAGAHLVALVSLAGDHPTFKGAAYLDDPYAGVSTRVKAVIPNYGIYDMAQQWNHDVLSRPRDNIVEKYLGASPVENRKLYFDASPMSYVTKDQAGIAFQLSHGTEDDIVDRAQSDAFLLALKQAGIPAFHFINPGAAHGWNSEPIDEPGSFTNAFAPCVLRFLEARL